MKPRIVVFTIILIILILAGLGYFYFTRDSLTPEKGGEVTKKEEPRIPPAGWKEFKNEHYSFSIFYPEEMKVKEKDEGGESRTFSFENTESAVGFQIFVVPYGQTEITQERFLRDVPSGVRENTVDFEIDGVRAVAFNSKNNIFGDTSEVWVIHNHHLFEFTTLRPLSSLLEEVVKSLDFI